MENSRDPKANSQEFVLLSVDGYKQLANIDNSGENLYWTTDLNKEMPVKFKLNGEPGYEVFFPKTIPECLLDNLNNYPEDLCCHSEPVPGTWKTYTWKETWEISLSFARSLISHGITKRSAVNIIGFNSNFWLWAFYGTIMADNIAVGVYTTNTPSACQYVAEHSSAEVIVAEDIKQMNKYLEILDQLPHLKLIIVYGVDHIKERPQSIKVITWNEFLHHGSSQSEYESTVYQRMEEQVPGMCCNIVYTSGTTGNPKGVMLTHDNMTFTLSRMLSGWEDQDIEFGQERCVSYLPLSHSAAQINDIMSNLVARTQLFFARPDALQGTLVDTLNYAKPTLFLGVPRVWEKMEERLKELAASSPSILQKISGWAKGKGTLNSQARMKNEDAPFGYNFAHFLILGRIKKALGLDQAKLLLVGAAPMKKATFEYFQSLDMPIMNLYGMSESTGPETITKPGKYKDGTVGYAIEETHIKIDKRDRTEGGQENEGEICFRGRNNFIGYLNNEKATRETLDQDGYIHSGDLGTKDEQGFVQITGRIKELIITAGGENVAPVLIEDSLKNMCPIISNVMIIGDDKKYLSALITFKVEVDNSTGMGTPTKDLTATVKSFLKSELGVSGLSTTDEAIQNEKVMKYLQSQIDENNSKAVSRAQHIRKFRILPYDFSMEGNELTPTLKLKRRIVHQKYQDIIQQMYPEEEGQQAKL